MNQLNYSGKGSEKIAIDNSVFESNDTQISEMNTIFCYNGNNVTMRVINGIVFVNLTEFAKPFPDKNLSQIINSKEITSYVTRLSEIRNYSSLDLLQVRKGNYADGAEQGTWAHQKIAIRVAQKLSTDFAIWVDDRIEELLKYGMTATQPTLEQMLDNPDLVISLATQLKQERNAKAMLQAENHLQSEQLKLAAPKVKYVDDVLQSQHTYTSTQVSKELGFRTAEELHKKLKEKGVMFYQSGQWMLTANYCGKEYTKPRTTTFTRSDGSTGTNTITVWTERGRAFLYTLFNLQNKAS